jgi:hypothetical protein
MHVQSRLLVQLSSNCRTPPGSAIVAAAVLLILAFCAASPLRAAGNVSFTAPVNVSSDGLGTVPQILLDSSGNIDIAYGDVNSLQCPSWVPCSWTGTIKFSRSTDGGRTFSSPLVIAQNAGPMRMALESDCIIDISYFASGDVFFAQSTDCGKSFTAVNVTKTGTISFGAAIQLVVNSGVAEIAWQQLPNVGPTSISYAQGNAKTGFSTPIVLFTQRDGSVGLFGMAVSNGTTDILWYAGEFNQGIYFLDNPNGGKPASVAAAAIASGPFFSLDPSGNMNVVWGVQDYDGNSVTRFARSIAQSGTFGTPQTINVYGDDSTIATDPQGNIGIASEKVEFVRSTDGGATFSTRIFANTGVSGTVSLVPQIVLPSSSFAGVTWGQDGDLWFNSSTDSGSTFSTPINITNNHSNPIALQIMTDSASAC